MKTSSRVAATGAVIAALFLSGCSGAGSEGEAAEARYAGCVDVGTQTLEIVAQDSGCAEGLVPVAWNGEAEPGPAGEQGERGLQGTAGTPGATGEAGKPGAAGKDGLDGAPGVAGTNGTDGIDGADGVAAWTAVAAWNAVTPYTAGPPTSVVTHGGSAYVAAESNVGAEPGVSTAWIAVATVGAKGEKGEPGVDGAPGPQGATGNSALSAYFGQTVFASAYRTPDGCTLGQMVLSATQRVNGPNTVSPAPMGLLADGSLYSINQNPALFALLGN